jgi:hypothetical protein
MQLSLPQCLNEKEMAAILVFLGNILFATYVERAKANEPWPKWIISSYTRELASGSVLVGRSNIISGFLESTYLKTHSTSRVWY